MRFPKIILAVGLLGVTGWAQSNASQSTSSTQAINAQNANNICRIYFSVPKPGAATQLEAARKKHNDYHRAQKDTWTWNTWQIVTGERTGNYVTASCGHAWKDFDEWEQRMGKSDAADAAASMGPYIAGGTNGFYIYRADMSLAPANQAPAPMSAVTIYSLHAGAAPDFIAAIKKATDALGKQPDWPKTAGWLQLLNGGEASTFVLLSSRKNWAAFEPQPKSVVDVETEVYGKEGADQIAKAIRDSTKHISSETAVYRPDLSYLPGK